MPSLIEIDRINSFLRELFQNKHLIEMIQRCNLRIRKKGNLGLKILRSVIIQIKSNKDIDIRSIKLYKKRRVFKKLNRRKEGYTIGKIYQVLLKFVVNGRMKLNRFIENWPKIQKKEEVIMEMVNKKIPQKESNALIVKDIEKQNIKYFDQVDIKFRKLVQPQELTIFDEKYIKFKQRIHDKIQKEKCPDYLKQIEYVIEYCKNLNPKSNLNG